MSGTQWQAISESDFWDLINEACERMSEELKRFWEMIRIPPEKWKQDPRGNQGNGFWAVGIIETTVIWYNDIEEGFNSSPFTRFGTIAEYWCDQDELEHTLHRLMFKMRHGYDPRGKLGPPQPMDPDRQ